MMPGPIPDPSVAAGSLPGLGLLAGISATTLTDQLKYADLCNLGAMLSPLHLLGKRAKRVLPLKTEVRNTNYLRTIQLQCSAIACCPYSWLECTVEMYFLSNIYICFVVFVLL